MCLDCGCNEVLNDHGDPDHILLPGLQAAADASGVSLTAAAQNILGTVTGTLGPDVSSVPGAEGSIGPFGDQEYRQPHVYARDITSGAGNCVCGAALGDELHTETAPGVPVPDGERVSKAAVGTEMRFILGLAYRAGRDPRIAKGLDGGRDFFTAEELELACHSYLPGGGQVGLYHMDDPSVMGHMTVTENYIYRNEVPWVLKAADGTEQVIKCGDWVIGGICDETGWQLVKSGKVQGFSPQGVARRRRVRKVTDA